MYRISASIRSTHTQDGAILLDIERGQMFNLNLVGSRVFQLLKTVSHESEIAEVIAREFEISNEVAANDVQEFFKSLRICKLIDEVDAGEKN